MLQRPTNVIDVMPIGVWKVFIPILRVADGMPSVFVVSFDLPW